MPRKPRHPAPTACRSHIEATSRTVDRLLADLADLVDTTAPPGLPDGHIAHALHKLLFDLRAVRAHLTQIQITAETDPEQVLPFT